MPDENADDLLRLYALLVRSKGCKVTQSDIHDAWCIWMAKRDLQHISLVPYEELPPDVKEQDEVFVKAVRRAAKELGSGKSPPSRFSEVLFPSGPPTSPESVKETFDLYKMMVDSSEGLVGRRQAVNTFFLTINGALLTALGLVLQSSGGLRIGALGLFVLAVAGAILCGAWRSLITSFGQLNRGKFKVINSIESHLQAAIYAAEWEALGRGEDPKIYRSFTSREIWVPNALFVLHSFTALAAILIAIGCFKLGPTIPVALKDPAASLPKPTSASSGSMDTSPDLLPHGSGDQPVAPSSKSGPTPPNSVPAPHLPGDGIK
ncbi:MAG: hypothetical protein ABI162_11690 [Luteolibacter sp.]